MSQSPPNTIQLQSMGSQGTLAPLPQPPDVQNPPSHSWASLCGPPPWGLSCLLALQHILVLASLLCTSHLLLLQSLPAGGLSFSPAQLLASSLFACGVSTSLQTWMGSRLPLVQAPSLQFLIPALVLTSQKLPLALRTPGNCEHRARAQAEASLVLHLCEGPGCHGLELWNTSIREVSGAVVVSGLLQATLGLLGGPGHLFPRCGPLVLAPSLVVAGLSVYREVALLCSTHWGLASLYADCAHGGLFSASGLLPATPTPLEASFNLFNPYSHPGLQAPLGISMALAASTSSLGCYALCGQLLRLPSPPPHACSRGLSLEGLGSVLAGLLGSPMGTASSFPNVGTVGLLQAGPRRVAHLVGLFCVALGLSPRLAQLLTTIPLPMLGGMLGVTQAMVLSSGFSSFHLADIDSGRNVFIVGFSIFTALLLPRWFREAPVLLSTVREMASVGDDPDNFYGESNIELVSKDGWSPLDVLLRSLLTEPIFLAGLLGFLLENTISGTRLERGLGQGLPPPFTARKARMPQKSREKADKEYELPFSIQNLCPCIPQPLRCLCPLPQDSGNEERGPAEPGETADLLPDFGDQCPQPSRGQSQ
ncbi:hypothetical protein MG293_004729 [Ovis ammon polii]|uniref:Solute carrier family 23 member 3 n=1 Tax=Ovis ammon polii TaxID=230172 RepID=A0AAD4UE31_OVIAM|nr:hypothetical protein MG293_004729 [Ovis ammon polii]